MKRGLRPSSSAAVRWIPFVLLTLAAAARFASIDHGLPHFNNADEPRMLDMAASVAWSLRPASFRQPTLWPTLLAAAYAVWFAVWSQFGFRRGVGEFAARFAFQPTSFALIARVLAAACQLGALALVARTERSDDSRWPFGAALLAVSPLLVELAHAAKPDSLMFLLSTGAVATALEFQRSGKRSWLLASALLAGLACSTQYSAAPAVLVVPAAWLLGEDGPAPISWLLQAGLIAALGFLCGTPFALIDSARFVAEWSDSADLGRLRSHEAARTGMLVLRNIWCFAGEGSLGGAAALLGAGVLLRRAPRRALLLLIPVAAYAALLSASFDGGAPRLLLGAFVPLALLAGEGFSWLAGGPAWRRGLVAVLALAPGLVLSARVDADLSAPDTRAEAAAWLLANVPAGATLLLDQPRSEPYALMDKEQCEELAARAATEGSPRAQFFRELAAHHPGGGWRIDRILRSPVDRGLALRHVAPLQADGDFLDVRPGLDVARAARVDYVVTSSDGADPRRARELATFFSELAEQAEMIHEFRPVAGRSIGPWLRVFRLKR